MTEAERQLFLNTLQKYKKRFVKDKAASKKFLIKAGILTQKGALTSAYKTTVCTPHEQD